MREQAGRKTPDASPRLLLERSALRNSPKPSLANGLRLEANTRKLQYGPLALILSTPRNGSVFASYNKIEAREWSWERYGQPVLNHE